MKNPSLQTLLADVAALWPSDLGKQDHAGVDWLWRGYLAAGNVTLLTSQWKAGKTTLLALLLDRLRVGGLMAGLPVRAGKAVVVSEESLITGIFSSLRNATMLKSSKTFLCPSLSAITEVINAGTGN